MSAPIVDVHDVHHTFGKDVHALAGVDLAIEPGIVYGLLGPNGAGKTTLIRVLATLLVPSRGRVTVAGVDVLADPVAARTRIGLAGQFAAVDDYLSGRENVEMVGRLYGLSARDSRRRTAEVLEGVGLAADAGRLVRTYSGGMRRRLDLAASLVGRPQVMFLDEPTTGIDPRNRLDLWELIQGLVRDGTTVLLTTQYLEEADQLANRIGVIDRGRIITEGTADELKDTLETAVLQVGVAADDRTAVAALLTELTGDEPTSDANRGHLRVPARTGTRLLLEAVRRLDAAGIEPSDVALLKPSLDDVFLSLTGERPGTDDQAADTSTGHRPSRRTGARR
ncbi:ATP-binding cassette domain-containing protein [Egicoccus sp. AB-alg6-2]|uniref:ATP-binding cassette domain-containing protein n=1 Tax=Egicoccus sp. AB-alg6-2 TaxID=3242692 RepID=UPI00359CC202